MNSQLNDPRELRRWAAKCEADARKARDADERERLERMQAGLTQLAASNEWLEGQSPAVVEFNFGESGPVSET